MPQFDPSSFPSQIFWLCVMFGFIYFMMARIVLPHLAGVLESRESHINNTLQKAKKLAQEAEQVKKEHQEALDKSRAEARRISEEMMADVNREIATRQADLQKELTFEGQAAEERIQAARDKALQEMGVLVAELSGTLYTKLTDKEAPATLNGISETTLKEAS